MVRRTCLAAVLLLWAVSLFGQTTIYWKKDHIYNGPGGKEIAVAVPAPSDATAPSAPTGVSYSSLGATSVQISWSASSDSGGSGLAGYKVYRQYSSNAALPVGTVGTGSLSFVDQPLKPSTGYVYTVVAFDAAQNHSSPSSSVSVTTSSSAGDGTAPSIPGGVTARALAYNQVHVDWLASTDAGGSGLSGYKVYRGGNLVSGGSPITATNFTESGLSANTAYAYTVRAVDGNSNTSNDSSAGNVTTPFELLFKDDFNRPDASSLGTGWSSTISGTTAFNLSTVHASCSAYTCYSTNSTWGNKIKASVDIYSQYVGGLYFWHYIDYNQSAYYQVIANYYSIELKYVEMYYGSSTSTVLATGSASSYTGTLRVEADGSTGHIQIFRNSQLVIDYTDTESRPYPRTGYVGITGVVYPNLDNFSVYRLP